MKRLLVILITIAFIFPSCKKSNRATSYMNTATITGLNLTQPVCGAAYRIVIHGIADSEAQFNTLPSGSENNLSTATFPINVNINWHHNTGTPCDTAANIITIDAIASTE